MKSKIKIQEDLFLRITKALENFKKSNKERRSSIEYVKTRLELLEQLWTQFSLTHTQLIQDSSNEELTKSTYWSNELYDKTEEVYIDCKCLIKDTLNKIQPTPQCTSQPIVNNSTDSVQSHEAERIIRLPKISIPTFSGKYAEWVSFRDLFISLVHENKSLDNVQKLHYLKGHLAGEAEQLLRHIQITQDNYATCWDQLEKRYNNKKYLSSCILKRLLSQRNVTSESAHAIKELLDTTNECLHALNNLGIDTKSWDIIIIHIVCLKLDVETRKQWELKSSESCDELPTYSQLQEFLETRFRALEFIEPKGSKSNSVQRNSNFVPVNTKVHHVATLSCAYCTENHKICNCKAFCKLDTDSRRGFVQSNNLCFNCLGSNHSVYTCRQSFRCRICKKKHHSLLHPQNVSPTTDSKATNQSVVSNVVASAATPGPSHSDESTTNIKTHFSTIRGQVLLATALVNAKSENGKVVTLRCLLDQGSQASLITESAVQLLGLKKTQHKSNITGLGSDESAAIASKSKVNFIIQSLLDTSVEFEVNAFVLSKLTSVLPERRIVVKLWSELANLNLADPTFDQPSKIDLLLGADVYGKILMEGLIKGSKGAPTAQKTALGWILSGPIYSNESVTHNNIRVNHVNVNDNDLLRKFWEMESDAVMSPKDNYNEDERKCEEIYAATTTRDSDGRYVVKLPFRDAKPACKKGNFEFVATKRLSQLERRFHKDPQLKKQYKEVIDEYVELGHMELVPQEDLVKSDVIYLPHHAVVREDKSTSKVRVVFDASCPGSNGISLNQDLLVGPQLQPDLRHILMKWRCFPISLVADIVKMYRQVKVQENDVDCQRILWRDNQHELIKHYRLLRVTFGTAAAPYLAVRTLHQVAHDAGDNYPLAVDRILRDFYVDDLLSGCETVKEGEKVYKELNELLGKAGFELQKWNSSNEELMQLINKDMEENREKLHLKIDTVMKILGLTWNRRTDSFEYSVNLPPLKLPVTKRSMISDISRLFDPLGWLAPVIICAKIFIQRLWSTGIEWDDEVPAQLLSDWLSYRERLNELTNFCLPRWVHTEQGTQVRELQGFCDASTGAFAAVVYLRTINEKGEVNVSLITAKTKVAPIKQVSIPRLELCGAVLLTKLLREVSEVMNIEKSHIHAWTDSTIVLAWLNSRPNKWKTFVANRVAEILTSLDPSQWSHVSSKDNPADCASRGTQNIGAEELWKEGPGWLKEKQISYKNSLQHQTNLEEKTIKVCLLNTHHSDGDVDIIERFSSLPRLIRVLAFCKRFVKLTKKKPVQAWLTTQEIQESLLTCIKLVQSKHFEHDIAHLKKEKRVNKKSKLTSLNPFLDDEGILRVGGRLQHAHIGEQMKHPIIIPHKSHLTDLIVADAHSKTLHGGIGLMLNFLRSKYLILGAKNLVRSYVHKCVTCIRYSASSNNPLMGQLPAARGQACRPFRHSGVDYAGPVNIRTSKGRGHHSYKGYICLFICMSTKAIHLEVVSDMTSDGFMAAFRRFVGRRGHCSELWSDNGTTFVGASRELKNLFAEEKSNMVKEIADQLATNGTSWHFIPPHAPNFGGLWEAGIKSTKHHLKRIIGNLTLTFEEMTTVLSQIEACLNSRPLAKGNTNSDDPMPLTPGHFLVGEPLVLVPDSNYELSAINSLKRWQLTQRLFQDFWRRWSSEYLTQFHHRYKWALQSPEPSIGDVVLIKEDNLPPSRWLYGMIVQKHSGSDGITRVVSLKCKGNIIKRAVNKLCFLPSSDC